MSKSKSQIKPKKNPPTKKPRAVSKADVRLFKRLDSLTLRQARADAAFAILAKANPNPRCELYYKTPFQLLVSVVLSAQATDKSVNACMTKLHDAGLAPSDIIKWGEERFREKIKTIGLARTKAKNVVKLSQLLLEQHGGVVPSNRESLEALPGVGRKTANVILAEIFREPTLAVDTHVFRVSHRLGLQAEKTAEKAELELMKVIDKKFLPEAHHWLILHGRYICKAQSPGCTQCPLNKLCPAFALMVSKKKLKV